MQETPANRAQRSRKKRKLTSRKEVPAEQPRGNSYGTPPPYPPFSPIFTFPTHMSSFAPQNVPIGFRREKGSNQISPPPRKLKKGRQLRNFQPSPPPPLTPSPASPGTRTGSGDHGIGGWGSGGRRGRVGAEREIYKVGGTKNAITRGQETSNGRGSH